MSVFSMNTIDDIIEKLDLKPHPEGGYYRETYRSDGEIKEEDLNSKLSGKRNYSTCIYFLLTSENFSAFHRIKQDEIWHFYDGAPINLHVLSEEGHHTHQVIGNELSKNQLPQLVVKAGDWFAAEVSKDDSFALVGCTVSPGFSFEDFELAERSVLKRSFPEYPDLIEKFTRL